MYPLKSILVNCSESLLPVLRQALHNHPAVAEGEFSRTADVIDNCRWTQDEPRLLIYHLASIDDLEGLQRLRRTFSEWPILSLVDGCDGRSFSLLLLANRAGATQVVPTPLDEEDFRLAMEAIGQDYGFDIPNARMIAVSGVTGGCGATTLALNIAYQIVSRARQHTILAEMAFQKGMLATYLNVEPKYVIHDLLANSVKLDLHVVQQALTNIEHNFDILSGPHRQIMPLEVSPLDVNRLLDYLRRLCGIVVLDVPCTNDEVYVQTLAAADQVVLVAEQTLPSLRSLRLVLDMLGRTNLSETPLDGRPIHLVVNRYNYKTQEYSLDKLESLLQVKKLLTVGNDFSSVNAALNNGKPLKAQSPRCRIVSDLDQVVALLLSHGEKKDAKAAEPAPAGWGRRVLGRLARAIGLPA
jgi:pilus assembly protein CpaE